MTNRRVSVTGLGAITPSGNSVARLWDAVAAGHSAVTTLEGDQFANLPVRIGAQVRGFGPEGVLERALAKRLSPVQHWAVAAAEQALASGEALPWDPQRFGIIAATGSGPIDAMQQATRTFDARGPRAVPLTLSAYGAPDGAAAILSQRYGARGPSHGVSATCASGAVGLGDAMRRIRHGYLDAALVVGMEDCLNPVNLASNANMRALASGYEDDPAAASRPFDAGRKGFVMGQGAAAILLESTDRARARGATIYAELAGFGESSDAHHATAPHPGGRGAADAVAACLADARVAAAEIRHINAHGTGTPAGDAAELAAFDSVFEHAREIAITATKSSTGHLLGAAGVLEAIIAILTMNEGVVPPTINLDNSDFPDWDVVTEPRGITVDAVLSTSFGFGGHNAALLVTQPN